MSLVNGKRQAALFAAEGDGPYAGVVLNRPVDAVLTYRIPARWKGRLRPGQRRAALGELWRSVAGPYLEQRAGARQGDSRMERVGAAVRHLAEHIHEVPVHLIPCVEGRTEGEPIPVQASRWASIIPATWSFMLAARSRGLGTVWTTFHLRHEREAAEILGIPYDEVMQAALIPVAYTIGTDFKPGARKPLDTMVHWDGW